MVCSFSPDADYIVAGATDCSIYVWSWDTLSAVQASVAEVDSSDSNEPATGAAWHQLGKRKPQELCKLEGHKNDVMLLQFSPDGKGIATGSKDGTVRVSSVESSRVTICMYMLGSIQAAACTIVSMPRAGWMGAACVIH